MTTRTSPVAALRSQAEKMVCKLKAMERGDFSGVSQPTRLAESHARGEGVTFGIVMDDGLLQITMSWATIRETTEAALTEYIVRQMRGDGRANN